MNTSQFKIEEKLNESATTIVYKAFDQVLHRTVLLKVLHKHLANDQALRERFTREARACAALRSEHIVQIYDLTEIDGAPAIVMEFVEGRSLKEFIGAGLAGSLEGTRKAAVHILRALTVAHERGIIHRDIKPGNILVAENGTIKVTDFGLAYVALSPTVTMEGMVLGTPAYMAPEQIRGGEIDQRTDLFALGVTLVEMLTGERIFEGSTYSECMKKVLAFTVKELERFDDRSTPEFSSFLRKLLHPSKEERFVTSREALSAAGDTEPAGVLRQNGNAHSQQPKAFILTGIAAVIIVVIVLFGWMRRSVNEIPPLISDLPVNADTVTVVQDRSEPEADGKMTESVPSPERISKSVKSLSTEAEIIGTDSGRIFLTSTPWAKVYVNNRLIGETPIARPIVLAAGTHTVMFTNPSFDPIVSSVTVEPGRDLTVNGNFTDNAGFVNCVVTPWAEVFVDEQYKDTTPLTRPLMLSSGTHTLRFKNAAYADVIRQVTVTPHDTITVTVTFNQ